MGALVAGLSAPPEPFVPAEHHGVPGIAILVASWGSAEEHAAAVEPLRGRGALFEFATPIPYVALQHMLDESAPSGFRAYDKALNLDDLSDEAIQVIIQQVPRKQFPLSFAPIFPLIGRFREVPDDATAFGSPRSRRWAVSMVAIAPDEETFAADKAWVRDFWASLRPFAPDDGAYVNFEADVTMDRVRASYGPAKYRGWPRSKRSGIPTTSSATMRTSSRKVRPRLPGSAAARGRGRGACQRTHQLTPPQRRPYVPHRSNRWTERSSASRDSEWWVSA